MTKVYWVQSGATLIILGEICNAHLVAEAGATIRVCCQRVNGNS